MKKILNSKYLPFIITFIVLLLMHIFFQFGGDDNYFKEQLKNQSLFDYISYKYFNWSSRIFIESILIFLVKINVNIWRVLDSFLFTLSIFVVMRLINSKNDKYIDYIGCLLFLLYPLTDMTSAGWGATTTNYLWCYSFGVISFLPLINLERGKRNNLYIYIVSFISLIYAINQELMCAIILGINFLYLIDKLIKKEKIDKYNIICTAASLISIIFIFTCPGNYLRQIQEIDFWYPDFKNYGFLLKLYLGIVPTMNIFFTNKIILFILLLISSFASYKYSKKSIQKFFILSNFIIFSLFIMFKNFLILIYPSINSIYEMMSYKGVPDVLRIKCILLFFAFLLVGMIAYMLIIIFGRKKLLPFFIFLAGLTSRIVMGFSPTIFASSNRTALFMYMSLIITTLFIINKLYDDKIIGNTLKIIIISLFAALTFFNVLATVVSV